MRSQIKNILFLKDKIIILLGYIENIWFLKDKNIKRTLIGIFKKNPNIFFSQLLQLTRGLWPSWRATVYHLCCQLEFPCDWPKTLQLSWHSITPTRNHFYHETITVEWVLIDCIDQQTLRWLRSFSVTLIIVLIISHSKVG